MTKLIASLLFILLTSTILLQTTHAGEPLLKEACLFAGDNSEVCEWDPRSLREHLAKAKAPAKNVLVILPLNLDADNVREVISDFCPGDVELSLNESMVLTMRGAEACIMQFERYIRYQTPSRSRSQSMLHPPKHDRVYTTEWTCSESECKTQLPGLPESYFPEALEMITYQIGASNNPSDNPWVYTYSADGYTVSRFSLDIEFPQSWQRWSMKKIFRDTSPFPSMNYNSCTPPEGYLPPYECYRD